MELIQKYNECFCKDRIILMTLLLWQTKPCEEEVILKFLVSIS